MDKTPRLARTIAQYIKDAYARHVWVIGDVILDDYIEGRIERISPEAPVQVVNVESEFSRLGGAANVAHGLRALGANVMLAGALGVDHSAGTLRSLCEQKDIRTEGLVGVEQRPTIRKVRVISRGQQMIRLDWEQTDPIEAGTEERILAGLERADPPHAILLSDYAKGVLTDSLIQKIMQKARSRGVPVIADPKSKRFDKYRGATVITPNLKEFQAALPRAVSMSDDAAVADAAKELCEQAGIGAMLITLGEAGMALVSPEGGLHRIAAAAREVYDVTGAGDTVVAALAFCLASGADLHTAAVISNAAAGIVVGKAGTSVVAPGELADVLSPRIKDKVLDAETLTERLHWWRLRQQKIVFTNGCFDLLHAGHLHLLNRASEFGDVLIVGLNTDASVRRLNKGTDRPLIPEQERAAIVAGLDCVNAVVLFDEDTPLSLIKTIKPDVLVKGSDYSPDQVVGRAEVEAHGGKVALVDLLPDKSTSALIRRIREKPHADE
ncbi:MAG: D-glycero-beta-D-manno-heptose-7-phosphate kinase [Desulfobacteraceae bacterium]|nr:D-glycero-beta-D-manno-heptose-7-phosphate kinase [Desulfobacteraceae bacterium]